MHIELDNVGQVDVSTSSVPQGSNLSLLFVLFIGDLLKTLNCGSLAFAVDLKLYSSIMSMRSTDVFQQNETGLELTDYNR